MDLSKIKALIDFVGKSNVSELSVTEKGVTVRIFRNPRSGATLSNSPTVEAVAETSRKAVVETHAAAVAVKAPVFGVLHRTPAPGEQPFVKLGDLVAEGQTLFVIEAMKVFNTISAPRSGRIVHLTDIDGGEVETGNLLAEIA
ncbi:acetyl-CoA carboxylase biotin carboxyl carrier protein [Rhizobium rhizoryzae]|jgi:acetyl-CoA carboxylase biotin carboxyl carrier protein|uniref:Biotin carboxyl carrier protein of acetyl-CoA carboxylase n=1 Tax=Rhizobium rhizoryzae TaxID=451876 RepID=A0A7W6PUI8_9HYPH|nr:biotin/lipoyl-containing protein [Rhizobium rhizoryzae]MBB4145905.1 acetyl-CoA carboxylase biotin carboxyl carrier protein [Rhizobium rhizoryzae]